MTVDRGLLDRLRSRGEEVLTQVSAELMSNPRFMKAMEGAMRGKERLEEGVGRALQQMNVPTRAELQAAPSPGSSARARGRRAQDREEGLGEGDERGPRGPPGPGEDEAGPAG
jgi:hypothetical protein